jgi:hypothetical protein
MFFFQRIKNLWALSRFKITEFDNKLLITKDEKGELIYARPVESKISKAQIIKRNRDEVGEFIKEK